MPTFVGSPVLLPVGVDGLFIPITREGKRLDFKFDSALSRSFSAIW